MMTNLLQAMAHGGMVHPAQNHQEFIAAIAAHKLVLRRNGAQFLGKIADILITLFVAHCIVDSAQVI